MRGCLFVLVFAAAFALGAAWLGGPTLAGALVEGALTAAGFEGRDTTVRVIGDPPISVLAGRAARVEITSRDATIGELDVADLQLTLVDVDLTGRRFASVLGTFEGVVVRQESGSVPVERIELSGPAGSARVVATLDGGEVERLATAALRERIGVPIVDATLGKPDVLVLTIAGRRIDGRFAVEPDGGLSLVAPLPGSPRIVVLEGGPLVLNTVAVLEGELVLTGVTDVGALVR